METLPVSRLRPQKGLDRATLVHSAIALRNLIEGQGQVEYLARIDLAVPHEVDEFGQVAPHRARAAVQVNVLIKQLLAIELDAVGSPKCRNTKSLASLTASATDITATNRD
jgi:hypothetical protein